MALPADSKTKIAEKLNKATLLKTFDSLKHLRVLIIGDTIVDQYIFVYPKSRAIKDPILSAEYDYHETYAGGILAIANHISDFVHSAHVVTILGDQRTKEEFVKQSLRKNVTLKTFIKKNAPTTIKRRYVDSYRDNNKLFKVEYINDEPITNELSQEITAYLSSILSSSSYDLVVVGDFGHGFIDNAIRSVIQEKAPFLAINVQSNSANMGYNYITQYQKPDFVTINNQELRLPLGMRFEPLDKVIQEIKRRYQTTKFLITLGKTGSIYTHHGGTFSAPILTDQVKDTIGAGDSSFSITSLLSFVPQEDEELIPLIANCAGAIIAKVRGNKESLTKQSLLDFVETLNRGEQP